MLQSFERRFGGLVEGAFARVFKGEVHPSEIAAAMVREMDARRQSMGHDRVTAPNEFTVALGDSDYARLSPWSDALGDELASIAREHAAEEGYGFVGPVHVTLVHDGEVGTGIFHLDSETASPSGGIDAPAAPLAPPTPPAPAYRPPSTPAAAPPTAYRPPVDQAPPAVDPLATVAAAPPVPPPAAMTEMYGPRLVQTGATPPREHSVARSVTVIGRSSENDIVLDDPGVSRRHAELRRTPDGYALTDLGSTNGTRLNGTAVTTGWVHADDRIEIGSTTLVFRNDSGSGYGSGYGEGG